MKNDFISHFGIGHENIDVIPNPVSIDRINQSLNGGTNPFNSELKNIVSVGRLNHQKGFDLLLNAMCEAVKVIPNLHLTIIGDGADAKALKKLTSGLGIEDAVTFAGHKDNPFLFMKHADLLISSSRWEGLPNVILESLACGTPVLAFDCPGGTNEIIREGENGWLIPAGDWERMGEKIAELMMSSQVSENLTKKALLPEKFHVQNVVRRYEELLIGAHS